MGSAVSEGWAGNASQMSRSLQGDVRSQVRALGQREHLSRATGSPWHKAGRARSSSWARVLPASCWLRRVNGAMRSHVGFKKGRDVAQVGLEWRAAPLLRRSRITSARAASPLSPKTALLSCHPGRKLRPVCPIRHREDLNDG